MHNHNIGTGKVLIMKHGGNIKEVNLHNHNIDSRKVPYKAKKGEHIFSEYCIIILLAQKSSL